MGVRERLGRNLRNHRERMGLSQEKFADVLGLHRTYVSDLERGTRGPTIDVIEKMALALRVSAGSLLD
jgi:transcriptional regulator with XRE-family HTH domain